MRRLVHDLVSGVIIDEKNPKANKIIGKRPSDWFMHIHKRPEEVYEATDKDFSFGRRRRRKSHKRRRGSKRSRRGSKRSKRRSKN